MDTVTPGYPPPNLRATPLLSSWEKLLVVRLPHPDLPPIGPEEPLPLVLGSTHTQSPVSPHMRGIGIMLGPREGQFCWDGCGDTERLTITSVVRIQDPRLVPEPTLPLNSSLY